MNDTIKLMLDTGSELNILKIEKISSLQIVNLEETVFLKGIDSVIIPSIGTIEHTLMGHTAKFHIVPDEFFIPFDGILGSEYYTKAKAKINFLTNHLIVGEKSIKFQQNNEPPTETRISGITRWTNNLKRNNLPFIKVFNPPSSSLGEFMIDTGSEANIIKNHLLPDEIEMDNFKTVFLKGVGDKLNRTMGTIDLAVYGHTSTFHVVSDDFDIPCEGILGATYLIETNAVIDYEIESIRTKDKISKFTLGNEFLQNKNRQFAIEENKNCIPNIPEEIKRSDSSWSLDAIASSNQEYEQETPTNDSEELDSPIYPEHEQLTWCTKDKFQETLLEISSELNLDPYSDLEIFETYETFQGNFSEEEIYGNFSIENKDAVSEEDLLINKLRLNDLNENERNYIIKFVTSNKDRFFKEGQKLEAASTVMHRIPTIDNIPINVKQYKFPISLKEEVERQVQEMLDSGIIKPSSSPYNSPLWIVPKKWTLQENKNGDLFQISAN